MLENTIIKRAVLFYDIFTYIYIVYENNYYNTFKL